MTVKVYAGVSPNVSGGAFYYFTAYADFVSALGTPVLSFENENYLYTADAFRVALPNAPRRLAEICYMIVEDDATGLFVAYHIMNAEYVSGFLTLTLSKDMWATYIYKAQIRNIITGRINAMPTNGRIGEFDEGRLLSENYSFRTFRTSPLGDQAPAIVFVVQYTTGTTNIFENSAAAAQEMYICINRTDKPSAAPEFLSSESLINYIAGIYQIKGDTAFGDRPAGVVKAYLVDYADFATDRYIDKTARPAFSTVTPGGYNGDIIPYGKVIPHRSETTINYADYSYDFVDNEYFIGMKTKLVRAKRRTNGISATIIKNFSKNDLSVTLHHCGDVYDFTDEFSVDLTSNNGNVSTMQRLQKTIQFAQGIVSIGEQAAKKDYIGAGASAANTFSDLFSSGSVRHIDGGNGGLNFWFQQSPLIPGDSDAPNPYAIKTYPLFYAAETLVGYTGIKSAQIYGDVDALFSADPVVDVGFVPGRYVQTIEIQVKGVPENAREYIRNLFQSGIFLKKVEQNETLNLFT